MIKKFKIHRNSKSLNPLQNKIKPLIDFSNEIQSKIEERYKISQDIVLSELQFSILRGERYRLIVIIVLLILAILHFISLSIYDPKRLSEFLGGQKLLFTYLSMLFFYLFIESIILLRISILIKKRMRLSTFLRYLHTSIEITAPSIFLFILVVNTNSIEALIYPPYLFYYILIVLTILRLDMILSIFTGFFAFLQYFLLSLYILKFYQFENHLSMFFLRWELYFNYGIFFLIMGFITGFISKMIQEHIKKSARIMEDRNEVLEIFGQYVSPEVMNKLLSQKFLDITEKKIVTVMFLDIRNFTKFSESKDPENVIKFLNLIFEYLIEIINKYDGIVNKFLGDGLMAIFGAPHESEESALNTYKASIEILEIIEKIRQDQNNQHGDWNLKVGIAIHTGEVITGNVGSKLRKEYTIIGDTVNTTSRIEQLNKKFNSEFLISDSTYKEITKHNLEINYIDIKKVILRGKTNPIIIYKIK